MWFQYHKGAVFAMLMSIHDTESTFLSMFLGPYHTWNPFTFSFSLHLTLTVSSSVESSGVCGRIEGSDVCIRSFSGSGHRLLQLLWPHTAQTQTQTGKQTNLFSASVSFPIYSTFLRQIFSLFHVNIFPTLASAQLLYCLTNL